MNWTKKLFIRILICIYGLSQCLQNSFFINRKNVYAAENSEITNLVAVIVDKDIYGEIKSDIARYTTRYIQAKITNSKAIVLPIDTKTMKAHEISQILENMYFEGIKWEESTLIGLVLIGDIPMPVVQKDGFIYPSIYPYVDFEKQQFVYHTQKRFFVDNNNPNGQAEIWHGLIKFDTISQYHNFFDKIKTYTADPSSFADKAIRYDDFIGLKKYVIEDNIPYYTNKLMFAEDIWYHRYTSTLLDHLKESHNTSALAIGDELVSDLAGVEDNELQDYATMIEEKNTEAKEIISWMSASLPTLTLQAATQEMFKSYDGLIGSTLLNQTKNNVAWVARRYKNIEGSSINNIQWSMEKINQQDNWIVGDQDNNIPWLLIQINDYLESGLNSKIEDEQYYLNVPIPTSYLNFDGEKKRGKCTRKTYDYYQNYYFGQSANTIKNATESSIYRGTFQNITGIQDQSVQNSKQSIGSSYKIFSTQVEANRGYNIYNAQDELALYNDTKTSKQDLRGMQCPQYLFNREWLNICIKKRVRSPDTSADEDKCTIGNEEEQWGCESMTGFAQRLRWGASPLYYNASTNTVTYNYKDARLPIYDIAGSKKITNAQSWANSYQGLYNYMALIQEKFAAGDLQRGGNSLSFLMKYPEINGNDLLFTNQYPQGNLKNPSWRNYNEPLTHPQTNYFSLYNLFPYHGIYNNKIVLYSFSPGECWGAGSIIQYKTIDSRVFNTSPTRTQISDTEQYKFKNWSNLENFYLKVMNHLSGTYTTLLDGAEIINGNTSMESTWVIDNLSRIQTIINDHNETTNEIINFNINTLNNYDTQDINELAQTWKSHTISWATINAIQHTVQTIQTGLMIMGDIISSTNLNNSINYVSSIQQEEAIKHQQVEILTSRKTNILRTFSYINSQINRLKTAYLQSKTAYDNIERINIDTITSLQAKKTAITQLHGGNGCSSNYYANICTAIDTIIYGIQTAGTSINTQIDRIDTYENGERWPNNTLISIQPFVELAEAFENNEIRTQITYLQGKIQSFIQTSDENKKETTKGMNLTTADRPIDNIRNITFKGIGGDTVKLEYPNLYEVEVYNENDTILTLKQPNEIREAIKTYLKNKADTYNAALTTQLNKKNQYYQAWSAQFTLLGQFDPWANPSTHNYELLPQEYFIDKLIEYLDSLVAQYGRSYIYGEQEIRTDDDKIDMIANFLYQQNRAWNQKTTQDTVQEDIQSTQKFFDINQKIHNTVQTYLTKDNDQGKFLTPNYNTTWYEVGYINSDGADYISTQEVPSFIKKIQTYQAAETKPIPINTIVQDSTQNNRLQQSISTCEWVDTNGSALLFEFSSFSSPWIKAMKCWMQKIAEKPVDIKISFANALGPTFLGSFQQIQQTVENVEQQWTQYGNQRGTTNTTTSSNNNENDITPPSPKIQEYTTATNIHINKNILNVETTETSTIDIGMTKDVGMIKLSIKGTGDNCFGINKANGSILSKNICTQAARQFYNPYKEPEKFVINITDKKAGTTALQIAVCMPNASQDDCLYKEMNVQILPGPVNKITLTTPTNSTIEWGQLPIQVQAYDKYNNVIGQTIESYTIAIGTGEWTLYDGTSKGNQITFNNFTQAQFIYQAPISFTGIQKSTIRITPDKNNQKLLINQTSGVSAEHTINLIEGIITIKENDTTIYQTKSTQSRPRSMTITLPSNESDIQYLDHSDTVQINPTALHKLRIVVQDKQGATINTLASIKTTQGLIIPWSITRQEIQKWWTTLVQTGFKKAENFIIDNGSGEIALYPTFQAGKDIITIQIPGQDPINIPIEIQAWPAKKVIITLNKTTLNYTDNHLTTGTIQVVDTRNNKVTQATKVKLEVIGAANVSTREIIYSGKTYTYTLTSKQPGGEGYVFAYIATTQRALSEQIPGYQKFIVQEHTLPDTNLNVMYLNLFGTDRGNQRGYFSEYTKTINTITSKSDKLLATTTQLVDPNKIKQIAYIIDEQGQVQSIDNTPYELDIQNGKIVIRMPETANIYLGKSNTFSIVSTQHTGDIATIEKNKNLLIYIPEPLDSIITGNEANKTRITVNNKAIIDLIEGNIDENIRIKAETNDQIQNTYTITRKDKKIWTLYVWVQETPPDIDIIDPTTYGKTAIFAEWSTNTKATWIYIIASTFSKQGYASIEDSTEITQGIWFTSNFKNIANFANGQYVGKATLPYGSAFLINFGDPLLQRIDKNPNIPETKFDASLGQTIYTDPNKTIAKTTPIDFNNDGLKDLLVVYTDGTINLIKNYWGNENYKNLQELMIIAEPIKDIKIGDVDGNGYEDIIIVTDKKGLVYLNNQGIFTVDGKNICININTDPGTQSSDPSNFANIHQIFIQDADQDGKTDIISNDKRWDIKIFYGWSTNNGPNYLSTTTGVCDAKRYTRQKNNYKIIQRMGIKIQADRYIQDESLIHRKGLIAPKEWTQEEPEEEIAESISNLTGEELKALKDQSINDVKNFTQNLSSYIAAGNSQLAYTQNPLSTTPRYENNLNTEDIYYLPINEENETVSVYKQYKDMNGGILQDNDIVVIQTTIIAKKPTTKLTYIDKLNGPRTIQKDTANKIPSLVFTTDNTWSIAIDRNPWEWYQFSIDNIQLRSGQQLQYSYQVQYTQTTPLTNIQVTDRDNYTHNKQKDGYVDISIKSTDTCQKGEWILFNKNPVNKRAYEKVFNDIQATIDSYTSQGKSLQTEAINDMLDQIQDIENVKNITNVQGISESIEQWQYKSLLSGIVTTLSTLASNEWVGVNISSNAIDHATNTVAKKIDETLQGLCQWFTIGKNKGSCQGIPVPFNEAFLAPWAYHIFGCVPQLPNPLYIPFKMLNQTLGKWLPVLAFPTSGTPPIWPIIPAGAGAIFQWEVSQFRLYLAPTLTLWLGIALCFGPYSVGSAIPKPFNNLWGNCIVFAVPPISVCGNSSNTNNEDPNYAWPQIDIQEENLTNTLGTCNTPATVSNAIVVDEHNEIITTTTVSTPIQIVSASTTNQSHYAAAIPEGNFGGLISIDKQPISISSDEDIENIYDGFDLKKWAAITNQIQWAKTKWLVKCVVQDWMTRQIQYVQNNLTKMNIEVALPDFSTLTQGLDKVGNLRDTYNQINAADKKSGYIKAIDTNNPINKFSKQQLNNISEQLGNNPFEAVQKVFEEVPLVNIETKDLNVKVPSLTSEEIQKYESYITLWIGQNQSILEDRKKVIESMTTLCNTTEIQNANSQQIQQEIKKLSRIQNLTPQQQQTLQTQQELSKKIEICTKVKPTIQKFITFQANTEGIIQSVKANANVLEQYKAFPSQLYERTHVSDRYLTETSLMLSGFIGNLTYRLNTNANRYAQYVDAITLMIGSIKTRQAIIDFSVNRSEKCAKCSNDNYGSFSCSLSFLCPKLPVLPIPSFKIPNIYMDLSHIDVGMNITLPKINFIPTKVSLPQIPNIPEPPTIEVNRDILYKLGDKIDLDVSLPSIPVIPSPPTLPELPSFIPSIKMDLPVLPPAPKIPKIVPEINAILNVSKFIGKIFCIVKWGIGLVGEKGVKAKVEQITQRTWNVPIFDYFNMTTKFKDPPLQGFDYEMDAYATLKFNFDGVYDIFDNISQNINNIMTQSIETPINKAIEQVTDQINNNIITTWINNGIDSINQDIDIEGYQQNETQMIGYQEAYQQLRQGLRAFQNDSNVDKVMHEKAKKLVSMIDTKSNIQPATAEIQQIQDTAQQMIQQSQEDNKSIQTKIKEYDKFIRSLPTEKIVLVNQQQSSTQLNTPLFKIDSASKTILKNQEDPVKTYLTLNKTMVDGYLRAIHNDGAQKLNMTTSTYNKSKKYLETTKEKIDTTLLAYEESEQTPLLAASTCTTCDTTEEMSESYSSDISAYVNGVFVESYSGTEKNMINTVASTNHINNVQKTYTTQYDLNNDSEADILMYDTNSIYIKYADQQDTHMTKRGNTIGTHYKSFYSYATEHRRNRYISSLKQLEDNSDAYGYTTINDLRIKVVDKQKETKNFKTDGQTFDTLKLSRTNGASWGEDIDGYLIKMTNKIDEPKSTSSFRDFLRDRDPTQYILILPDNTPYATGLITIDEKTVKRPISLALKENIVGVYYYTTSQENISITLTNLPRKRLYTSITSLRISQEDLTSSQQKRVTLYKKSSPWSNQTVAGMQNLWDTQAPIGDIVLWRNTTKQAISTGAIHEWFINTTYTLKGLRHDDVAVTHMIIQQDGEIIAQKDNFGQTGYIEIPNLFFTGDTQQQFEFIAIDQNNNSAKQQVKLSIKTPDLEIVDVKKTGKDTADIIAKISNDLDEGLIIFQRLRNGVRKDIEWSNQNTAGWFALSPTTTIITGGIFTIGNTIGLYNTSGKEIGTINPDTGEISIYTTYQDTIRTALNMSSHIPVIEIKEGEKILFKVILPIKSITDSTLHTGKPYYEKVLLNDKQFGSFADGYCIKNQKNECILYTNTQGAIYIPGTYAYQLFGSYIFDKKSQQPQFIINDQNGTPIITLTLQIQSDK